MTVSILPTSSESRRIGGRGGFSFAEVLFAVLILGIGFIMVAAVFPVALTQTKAVGEETNAAAVARGAVNQLQQLLLNPTGTIKVPGTFSTANTNDVTKQLNQLTVGQSMTFPGMVMGFREHLGAGKAGNPRVPQRSLSQMFDYLMRQDTAQKSRDDPNYVPPKNPKNVEAEWEAELWRAVKGNLVLPSDRQFAWVPMFRRDVIARRVAAGNGYDGVVVTRAPVVQVFVIAVESRGGGGFTEALDLQSGPNDNSQWPSTLDAKIVKVELTNNSTAAGVDYVHFLDANDAQRAAEGTYLIISDDNNPVKDEGETIARSGYLNGRIIRLGNPYTKLQNAWEITPGTEFSTTERGFVTGGGSLTRTVLALMVGRPYAEPAAGPAQGYNGPPLDVAIYTAFVRVSD